MNTIMMTDKELVAVKTWLESELEFGNYSEDRKLYLKEQLERVNQSIRQQIRSLPELAYRDLVAIRTGMLAAYGHQQAFLPEDKRGEFKSWVWDLIKVIDNEILANVRDTKAPYVSFDNTMLKLRDDPYKLALLFKLFYDQGVFDGGRGP